MARKVTPQLHWSEIAEAEKDDEYMRHAMVIARYYKVSSLAPDFVGEGGYRGLDLTDLKQEWPAVHLGYNSTAEIAGEKCTNVPRGTLPMRNNLYHRNSGCPIAILPYSSLAGHVRVSL